MSSRAVPGVAAASRLRLTDALGLPWGLAVPTGLAGLVFWLGYNSGSFNLQSWTKVAIVVWWAVFVGVASGVWPRAEIGRAAAATVGLVALYAAFAGLSAIWAASAEQAVEAMARGLVYCGVLTLALLVCTRGLAARSSDGIALGLVGIALLAVVSRFFPSVFPADKTLAFLPEAHTRLSYPVTSWNGLAVLVALACPLLLRIAVCGRSPLLRASALAPFPVIAATVYLSSSRSGAVTAAVGSIAFVLLSGRRWRSGAAAAVALVAAIGAVVFLAHQDELVNGPLESSAAHHQGRVSALVFFAIAVTTAVVYGTLARRFDQIRMPRFAGRVALVTVALTLVIGIVAAHPVARWHSFTTPSTAAGQPNSIRSHLLSSSGNRRWQLWQSAFDEWKTRPLVGRGAGSYKAWAGEKTGVVVSAHSLYAQTAGELGLIGFGLIVGVFALGVVVGVRRALGRRGVVGDTAAAATAGFVAYAFAAGVDWMWEVPAVSIVAFALLGLAVGPATDPKKPATPTPHVRRAIRIAVALAAVVAVAIESDVLAADLRINDSQAAVARGDLAAARNAAGNARWLQPWSAAPYLQTALVDETAGRLAAARRSIESAIARDATSWQLWLVAARIEGKLGDRTAAEASLERARSLNPKSLFLAYAKVVPRIVSAPLRPLQTAIHDPEYFRSPEAPVAFAHAHATGATMARILINWAKVAGQALPPSSDPSDPRNSAYDWTSLDRQVMLAVQASLQPILCVLYPPAWARNPTAKTLKPTTDGSPLLPQLRDPPGDLGRFMLAAARRYSGTFEGLPRVRYWQVWNEPNLSWYLDPQYVNGQPASPAIYRQMVNAVADAAHSVHKDNLVVAGGQSPFSWNDATTDPAGGSVAIAPMRFMRALLCMSEGPNPKPTCNAQIRFDVWAHHPYTAGGPAHHAALPDDVSLGDLPEMKALLDAAVKAHHVVSRGPVRFWVTEFSWESNPPDPKGVPAALEGQWIAEAMYRVWQTGVSLLSWYRIHDISHFSASLYQGDGALAADKPKPALAAFRFPFVGHIVNSRIAVWGRTPWSAPGRVLVEESRNGGWTRLGIVATNRYGIFMQTFGAPHGEYVRARVLGKGGLAAPPFPLAGPNPPDIPNLKIFGS